MPLSLVQPNTVTSAPPAMRLHQIHSNMPFGHTNYVPEEETRNLRANFPEPDILQPFKDLATTDQKPEDSLEVTESVMLSKDRTAEYCREVSSNSLSHPDYRKLAWHCTQGDFEDTSEYSKLTRVKKVASPASVHTGEQKPSGPSEIVTPQLESRYRLGNAFPFCLNPQAAYLIHHATIIGQRKRLARELGTSVIYLNDRGHFRTLEHHLKARWERNSDLAHRSRANTEYQKGKKASYDDLSTILPPISQRRAHNELEIRGALGTRQPKRTPKFQSKSLDLASAVQSTESTRPDRSDLPGTEVEPTQEPETGTPDVVGVTEAASDTVLPPVESLLSSRVSMRSLYDNAEQSVRVKQDIKRRYLKYKDLSWERR